MINLSCRPAFGFETSTCNAQGWYKDMSKKTAQKTINIINKFRAKQYLPQLEFRENLLTEKRFENDAKLAWKINNITKAAGYIPGIGSLIGLIRIVSVATTISKKDMPNKYHHIARGFVEITSLGALLLVPDLILTSQRAKQAKKVNVVD